MESMLQDTQIVGLEENASSVFDYFIRVGISKCVLWVNPAQRDVFENVPLVKERRLNVPIRHTQFDLRLAPYLVPLDLSISSDIPIFLDSVEHALYAWSSQSLIASRGQPIAGWIVTSVQPKLLARYWARNCYIHLWQRRSILLRFHDPGVREWLWPELDEWQQSIILGPADEILSIGRTRKLLRQVRSNAAGVPVMSTSLVLGERQWNEILDYGVMHLAWVEAGCNSMIRGLGVEEWKKEVVSALNRARCYGIKDSLDRQLFAFHVLQIGSDFDANGKMVPVWEKTRKGVLYSVAIEEVFGCAANQLRLS